MEKPVLKNIKIFMPEKLSDFNILFYDDDSRSPTIIEKCLSNNFNVYKCENLSSPFDFLSREKKFKFLAFVLSLNSSDEYLESYYSLIRFFRQNDAQIFIIVLHEKAVHNPLFRLRFFDIGANMVTNCLDSLNEVLKKIYFIQTESLKKQKKSLTCPLCSAQNLTEDTMWTHLPMYHINVDAKIMKKYKKCPLCIKDSTPNLQVHFHNNHGPVGRKEVPGDFQEPVKLYAFALAVVHRKSDNKYLLVHEFANSGFWLPGGRVDSNEDMLTAAVRETKEEGGVDIDIKGILTVQFNHPHGRLRIIYYAEPQDENQLPKSIPDYESAGACYVGFEEIKKIPLRGSEPLDWIGYVENGGTIFPLNIFSNE